MRGLVGYVMEFRFYCKSNSKMVQSFLRSSEEIQI